jgi:streptogramin lyase
METNVAKTARRMIVAAVITLAASLGVSGQAFGEPVVEGTFPVTGTPGQIARGPDGNVWFTITGSSANKEFGRITPDGTVTEFDTPNDQSVTGIASGPDAAGEPDSRIWFSQNGAVVKWDPAAASGTAFNVAVLNGARGITPDAGGIIWVVDDQDGLIRIDPATGTVLDEVNVPGSGGRGIALGDDANLWWADFGQGAINRTLSASPYTTESFPVGGGPQEVAAGPPGQLGYSNQGAFPHEVGTISTAGAFSAIPAPDTDPFGVAFASDGNYWLANFFSGDLGRLTPGGQYARPVNMPVNSGPRYLAAGTPGTLWVSLETSSEIARVTGVPVPSPPPPPPTTARPRMTALTVAVRKRLATARFRLNRASRVRLIVQRRSGQKFRTVRTVRRQARRGANSVALGRLRKGIYRLRATAIAGGQRSNTIVRGFRIRR